jgi:hypothetical protein
MLIVDDCLGHFSCGLAPAHARAYARTWSMKVERPRAARYHFIVAATVTDLESGQQTQGTTWDVSLFGCQVMPGDFTRVGARVRVKIIHGGESFEAQGRVTNLRPRMGAGIVFTKVEEHHHLILDKWLAELRDKNQKSNDASPATRTSGLHRNSPAKHVRRYQCKVK